MRGVRFVEVFKLYFSQLQTKLESVRWALYN